MFTEITATIGPLISVITGILSLLTFLYVTVGGIVFKKKVVLHSLESKPVRFRVQLCNFTVQQLTNIVSARYYDGGALPPRVRQEIIELTAPTSMKRFKRPTPESNDAVFINLTNHPSDQWSEEQTASATAIGEIVDIPFPTVSSDCDKKQIAMLADDYEKRILQTAGNRKPVVHIMGEMNLTYAIVHRLRYRGITCVASTTERVAEELDGQKISSFKFVQFRDYE